MINFILVDDNDNHRKKVNNMIVSKMMNNKIEFKVHQFSDYSNELLKFIRLNKEDCIYILDLELPNGDGIDIARMIRNDTNNWINPIIILTAHSSLYYEVYKQRLQILDFIGKCEDVKTNLSENIDICLRMLNKDKVYRYTYTSIDYTIPLNLTNYIQRHDRSYGIVTKDDKYFQNISINIIKEELPTYFIPSSKGTLINLKNVRKIDWNNYMVYFKDGTSGYLVSKSHKKEIDSYECD